MRIAVCALLLLVGCGGDVNLAGPEPSPSPSPSLTPAPGDCDVIRTDIVVEVKGKPASAWALGDVATSTAVVTFKTDDPVVAAQCPELQSFTWKMLHFGDPLCLQQGNLNAKQTKWVCKTGGYGGLMQVEPDGYSHVPGLYSFTVLSPD